MSLGADDELERQAAAAGTDPLGQLMQAGGELRSQGWRVDEREPPEGGREVTLRTTFDDAAELSTVSSELTRALAGPELSPLEPFQLTVLPDRLELRGAAGLRPTGAVEELGLTPEESVTALRGADAVDYRISVTLPGAVLESNATQEEQSELVWIVAPGERVEIMAVGERPSLPWALIGGGLAGAAVGGAVLALIVRSRRSRAMVIARYRR